MLDSSEHPVSPLLKAVTAQHLKRNDLDTTETLDFPVEELDWQWIYSPETYRRHSSTDIASQLSHESSSKMSEIPFAAWVKRAMGRESSFYELFRCQHFALRDRIKKHITECQDFFTYYNVKRVSQTPPLIVRVCQCQSWQALRDQNPFARWAVAMAMTGPWQPDDPFPEDRLDFLVGPIKRTLCDWSEKDVEAHEQMCLLAIQYRILYRDGNSFTWDRDFNTDTAFITRVLHPKVSFQSLILRIYSLKIYRVNQRIATYLMLPANIPLTMDRSMVLRDLPGTCKLSLRIRPRSST
ncbi:MAG: hypothetical protein Q9188_003359, partial [Gyalolechia gomerana]